MGKKNKRQSVRQTEGQQEAKYKESLREFWGREFEQKKQRVREAFREIKKIYTQLKEGEFGGTKVKELPSGSSKSG